MKTLKPIIQTEEPDKYGRTVKVGITDGTTASFFQVMSVGEVRGLRDELTKFLNHSGAGTPVFDFKSFEGMRDRVKVGDTVRVRFEEFGMPDKHVVGRMVLPKRAYRVIKIDEIRGQHLSGKDLEEGKVRKFHIEQIIDLTERGEWFVGSENHYEIIANEYPPILEQPRFVWDIMIKCVETGTLVLYRMIESPLNSMYISK